MQIQYNSKIVKDNDNLGNGLLITPPIDEAFWMMRVPLSDTQAIVCFPKFGIIGVGFQHEEDWNTNLPWTSKAEDIFEHISHNKGDDSINDADCVEAIKLIQSALRELEAA